MRVLRLVAILIALVGMGALGYVARGLTTPRVPIGGIATAAISRDALQITPVPPDDVTNLDIGPASATTTPPGAFDGAGAERLRPPATLTPAPATRTPTAAAASRTIGSLSAADQDARVTVSGRIAEASGFSKGMLYTLDDGTGTVTLLMWSDVLSSYKDAAALMVGARVQARGQVNLYNNALEVEPARASDLLLLAPSLVPTPALRAIRSLTPDQVGTEVAVTGTVIRIADFSKGKYVTVRDDSGEIRVTIFSNVLNTMAGKDKLAIGARLALKAKLNLYNGELELVPVQGGVVIR